MTRYRIAKISIMIRFVQYFQSTNVCNFLEVNAQAHTGGVERMCLYRLLNSLGIFTIDCDP